MDFSGQKYGDLDALTSKEYGLLEKLFDPLILNWETMSMNQLIEFHGPFTQEIINERLGV